MATLANRVRVKTATTGTGTITLGAAVSGYLDFAGAGVANGAEVSYGVEDDFTNGIPAAFEAGRGTYDSSAGTLTRGPLRSSNSDAAISLSGSAEVFITPLKEDFDAFCDLTSPQTLAGPKTLTSPIISSPALSADSVDAITEIASALKSGSDTTLITGTAGSDGDIGVFNEDGDVVGSSVLTESSGNVLVGGGTTEEIRLDVTRVSNWPQVRFLTSGSVNAQILGPSGLYYDTNNGPHVWRTSIDGGDKGRMSAAGNILVGGASDPASAVAALVLFNGTAPTGSVTDGVVLFSEDVSASAELKVRDEAGNETTLSPHNFSLFEPSADDPLPWSYYSRNSALGLEANVDMSGAIRDLEQVTGKRYIHIQEIPKEDWRAVKAAEASAKRETLIEAAMEAETEVSVREAVETVPVLENSKTETETFYKLNPETGEIDTLQRPLKVDSGKRMKRLKPGHCLDKATGKIYRRKTRAEAEASVPIIEPKPMPPWLAAKLAADEGSA